MIVPGPSCCNSGQQCLDGKMHIVYNLIQRLLVRMDASGGNGSHKYTLQECVLFQIICGGYIFPKRNHKDTKNKQGGISGEERAWRSTG